MLGEIIKRRKSTIDYHRIWAAQGIDDLLSETMAVIATAVNEDIIRPPQGISNISEWCKKEGCWARLVERADSITERLSDEFWIGLALRANDDETRTAGKFTLEGVKGLHRSCL